MGHVRTGVLVSCWAVTRLILWVELALQGSLCTPEDPAVHAYKLHSSFFEPNPLEAGFQRVWSEETNFSQRTMAPNNHEQMRRGTLYRCLPLTWIVNDYTPCGDGYCRCRNRTADCSGYSGKLTYVPSLPADASHLIFAENGLTAISRDDFFQNVTDIESLDLFGNGLSYISPGAFRPLTMLKELRLMSNKLTYSTLVPVLSVTALTLLDLTNNPLPSPPEGLFHNYTLLHLHTLCLGFVDMEDINMAVFAPLTSLSYLKLMQETLSRSRLKPYPLPQLNSLVLFSNSFQTLPVTCGDSGPYYPNLTWLDLSLNPLEMGSIPKLPLCLPRLWFFSCTSCLLTEIPTNIFPQQLFPSLTFVILTGIQTGTPTANTIDRLAFNNTKLENLLLSDGIDFSRGSIHPDCLAGCPSLKVLDLSNNDLSRVSHHKLRHLLTHDHLTVLKLALCQLGHISADMFTGLPSLEFLYLYSNKLTGMPDGVFDKLKHLEALDLSSNRISFVTESTISPATRQRLKLVDVGDNPFQCDCQLRWFRKWLLSRPELFACLEYHHPCTLYTCDNLANTTVQSFYVADQACLWSPAVSKFIIASVLLLVLPLTLLAMVYRYRWHIRLLLYEAARGRTDRWNQLRQQRCRYDVFVCYDSDDLPWVQTHLMAELEARQGLRLCIHQRDFTLGVPIVENIEESVQTSQKILMVFSRSFALSPWCQFELRLCLSHVLEAGDKLLVILLEDIPSRNLTPAMMAVLKTMTYIEWAQDPDARASFWGRVKLGLSGLHTDFGHDRGHSALSRI